MLLSIRFRLSVSYVLLTVLTAGVVGAFTVGMVSQQLQAEEEQLVRAQARRVGDEAFQHFMPFPRRGALHELAVSSAVLGGYRVRILGADREVVADSGTELDARRIALLSGSLALPPSTSYALGVELSSTEIEPPDPATLRIMESLSDEANLVVIRSYRLGRGQPSIVTYRRLRSLEDLVATVTGTPRATAPPLPSSSGGSTVTVPVGSPENPLGFVELTSSSTVAAAATAATRKAVLFAALGAVLVAAAFGLFMGQGVTLGLRSLTEAAAEMERGSLSARARVRSRDEIGRLSQQFNRMAVQLESSFSELASERDTLRRFVADASHELRTPLTALKTFNELLRNAAADDPKARAEFLQESHLQLERLEWVTRSLLDLSRLDAGLVTPELAEGDAGELVAEACRLWTESAAEAGISLKAVLPPGPVRLSCDRRRMEIVLSNLLGNAVKFTPRGGEVVAGLEIPEDQGSVCFWVRDSGPGIADEDLPHVFERFYRGRSAPSSGSGLGLAIVKSTAELHGGTATVSTRPGYGSTFRVAIPRRTV